MNKFPFHPFFRYEVEYDEHRLAIAHEIGSRFLDIDVTTSMDNLNNGNTGIDADDNKDAINHDDNNDDDDDEDGRQCETKTNISMETENINKTPKTAASTTTTATNPVETELCNNTTANNTSSSCSNNHKNFQHHNGDGGDGSSTVTYDGDGGGGRVVDGGGGDNNDEGGGGIVHSGSGVADDETTTAGTTTILVAKLNGNSNKTPLSASDEFVLDILNDDLISRVRNKINSGSKELFEPCVKAVKAFLAGEPFQEFETSMYFHR